MNASLQAMRPRSPDTVVIARTKELEDSRVKAVNIDGIDLIVLRHANAISIFQGRCPHEGTLLSEGTIKDGLLNLPGARLAVQLLVRLQTRTGCIGSERFARLSKTAT